MRSRTLFERELSWILGSKEIDTIARIHRRETFRRGEGSHRVYHLHPPPLPILVLLPLVLSLVGIEAYQIFLITSALLYVDQNSLGNLLVTVDSKVIQKFARRELVEAYRRDQAVQSEIERELENQENQENQENIPPPPPYRAPEPLAANRAGPRLVFGRLPLPVLPISEEIHIARDAIPECPRTPRQFSVIVTTQETF